MVFKFADIITISAVWSEEKNIKGKIDFVASLKSFWGFATDREYYNVKSNGRTDEEELEVWECENEDDLETDMVAIFLYLYLTAYNSLTKSKITIKMEDGVSMKCSIQTRASMEFSRRLLRIWASIQRTVYCYFKHKCYSG